MNLNLHVHALVVDGVFTANPGGLEFRPARRLSGDDVVEVVAVIARRIELLLQRRGLHLGAEDGGAADTWSEEAPVLAGLAAASVQGRAALGENAGPAVRRYGGMLRAVVRRPSAPCHARYRGFDLHAGIVARTGQRERLDQLCRYALRPPLAEDRLSVDDRGDVWLRLRHRWSDGTTHLRFDPLELLARLAVLTPPADQPGSVSRRVGRTSSVAGGSGGVLGRFRRGRRRARHAGDVGRDREASPGLSVGGADAADVRARRRGLSGV